MKAGKVYMIDPEGNGAFVRSDRVQKYLARPGYKVAERVKMKVDVGAGPIVREFPGSRVPPNWQQSGEVMAPDDTTQGQSFPQALGVLAKRGAGDVVASAPAMALGSIPGAGLPAAISRLGMGFAATVPAEMGGQALRGEPVDPGRAAMSAGVMTALGVPFEAGAALLPKQGPRILSDVLRPRSKRQMELERVANRQSGVTRTPADYERAGRELAKERLRPSMEAEAVLQKKGEDINQSVEDILDQATAAGHVILPTMLTRSPEIAALRKEAAKEMDPAAARKAINNVLKAFVRGRSTPGIKNVQPKPTGVLDAQGNMVMTPFVKGAPAKQKPMSPKELANPNASDVGQKQVWRREANVINKARDAGTSTDKVQGIEARVSDALARAAKRQVEGLPFTTADPENPTAQVGAEALNERLERRIPLEAMIREFNMRPPLSVYERYGLLRGRLPISEAAEGGLGLAFSDPRYASDLLNSRRIVGAAAQDLTRRTTGGR